MALSKEQMNQLKQQLLDMKNEIEEKPDDEQLDQSLSESTGEISGGLENHPADQGTEVYDRERQQTFNEIDEDVLNEINGALERMDEGTYGICEETGKEIPFERLEALPYARRTVAAQEQEDEALNSPVSGEREYQQNMRDLSDKETAGAENSLTTDGLREEQDAFQGHGKK
ncbi:TraR/DksA family transcriptional regulator [Bacillus mangrovi]|uniref:TraR/DksA family transcriptional regulator n=1 Tax=Metabacillus mangrovi TaxID=1491830 RepID=A0A7X2V5L0_9BACI|nr:TraR/DksA C4-type zinc finger protein [Metabacillus mangrovi]MTH54284.1 TraR/DksA family transcriptional regulator [Metabacillus mangrovi]